MIEGYMTFIWMEAYVPSRMDIQAAVGWMHRPSIDYHLFQAGELYKQLILASGPSLPKSKKGIKFF